MSHSSLFIRRRENDGKYESVTPAMRMGLTDHVWSIGELMSFVIDKISTKKYHTTDVLYHIIIVSESYLI